MRRKGSIYYMANKLTMSDVRQAIENNDIQLLSVLKEMGLLDIYYENMAERSTMTRVGVRSMQKGICTQALTDYVKADCGAVIDGLAPEITKRDLMEFFNSGIFKAMYGVTDPDQIIRGLEKYKRFLDETAGMSSFKRSQRAARIIAGEEKL